MPTTTLLCHRGFLLYFYVRYCLDRLGVAFFYHFNNNFWSVCDLCQKVAFANGTLYFDLCCVICFAHHLAAHRACNIQPLCSHLFHPLMSDHTSCRRLTFRVILYVISAVCDIRSAGGTLAFWLFWFVYQREICSAFDTVFCFIHILNLCIQSIIAML